MNGSPDRPTTAPRRTRRQKAKEIAYAVLGFAATVGPTVAYGFGLVRPP